MRSVVFLLISSIALSSIFIGAEVNGHVFLTIGLRESLDPIILEGKLGVTYDYQTKTFGAKVSLNSLWDFGVVEMGISGASIFVTQSTLPLLLIGPEISCSPIPWMSLDATLYFSLPVGAARNVKGPIPFLGGYAIVW